MLASFPRILITIFVLSQLACKKSPVEPEPKSAREYTWEVTMLAYPGSGQTRMFSIWGAVPGYVYVSGFSLLGGQQGAMYRYDGTTWSPVVLPSPDDNYFWEMRGFAANDIWVAGWRLFVDPSIDSAVVSQSVNRLAAGA